MGYRSVVRGVQYRLREGSGTNFRMYVTSIAVSKASKVYFPFVLSLKQLAEFQPMTTSRDTRYDSITRRNSRLGQSKNYTHISGSIQSETQSSITIRPDDISMSASMNVSGKFVDTDEYFRKIRRHRQRSAFSSNDVRVFN